MYVQVGDFHVSMGSPAVPLKRILRNAVFSSPRLLVRRGPFVLISSFVTHMHKSYPGSVQNERILIPFFSLKVCQIFEQNFWCESK